MSYSVVDIEVSLPKYYTVAFPVAKLVDCPGEVFYNLNGGMACSAMHLSNQLVVIIIIIIFSHTYNELYTTVLFTLKLLTVRVHVY